MEAPSIDPSTDKKASNVKGSRVSRALDLDGAETPGTYRSDQCLLDAMQLLTVEQPRFQRFKEMIENFDEALAYKIAGKFDNTSKAKACEWMRMEIGNPPPKNMLKLRELYDLSIVSVGLAKYGADFLNERYDSGKMTGFRHIPVRSSQIRDEYRQRVVGANYKEGREAAHRAGLDVVVKINLGLPRPHRVSEEVLKTVLNHPSNFRSETGKTNRGEKDAEGLHPKVDRKFLETYRGEVPERLSYREVRRLNFIASFYQGDEFQTAMIENGGEHLYAAIRKVVKAMDSSCWHGSRDKRELHESSVSLHLRKDGELDLRRAVNKGLQKSDLAPRPREETTVPETPPVSTPRRTRASKTTSTDASTAARAVVVPPAPSAARSASEAKPVATPAVEKTTRSRAKKEEKRSTAAKTPSSARAQSLPRPATTRPTSTAAGPAVAARLTKDGKPDRRYRENKVVEKGDLVPLPRDNTKPAAATNADATRSSTKSTTRSKRPQTAAAEAPPAPTTARLKKDGTPDMRFAANKEAVSSR